MLNEFEQRLEQVMANHMDVTGLVQALGSKALVQHFGYDLQLGSAASPLLSGVGQAGQIAIRSDSWFLFSYINSCVIRPNSPQWFTDSGNVLIQVVDTGAADVLFSSRGSAGTHTATVSRPQTGIPLLLPLPRLIPPNTNIRIEATQLGVNGTDNQEPIGFWIALMGARIMEA